MNASIRTAMLVPVWNRFHPAREAALFFLHNQRSADKLKVACVRWLDDNRLALV
jgi:hypothetical protein